MTQSRAVAWWYGVVALAGLAFGLIGDRRPFGHDVLAHPLVVYFALVGAALLILRFVLARPVPQVLPERRLLLGCFLGLGAFLIGNWAATHLLLVR
jgi:hypothetical protein